MKHAWLVLALLLPAAPAFADGEAKPVGEVTGDLNGDGAPDKARLVAHDDDVDLEIFLAAGGKLPETPTVTVAQLGWMGAMAGQEPTIAIDKRGSLIVTFRNDSIGRDRWNEQYTIAWRQGALMVAGYDYQYRDTLDLKHIGVCSVNFLAGKGTRNDKPFSLAAGGIPLAKWTKDMLPKQCQFD